jgi:hypothetical protein
MVGFGISSVQVCGSATARFELRASDSVFVIFLVL